MFGNLGSRGTGYMWKPERLRFAHNNAPSCRCFAGIGIHLARLAAKQPVGQLRWRTKPANAVGNYHK